MASILAKSKYYPKTKSFIQATRDNIKDILKIKKAFPKLSPRKIIEIHNTKQKVKPKINMTSKWPSREQIIILMSRDNTNVIISHIIML